MQQQFPLSEQKNLDIASDADMTWTPVAAREPSLTQAELQLQDEQCLNRLGQRLTGLVTNHLALSTSSQHSSDCMTNQVFDALVQELSQNLTDAIIAIARAREAGGDRQPPLTLQHLAPQSLPPNRPGDNWQLTSGKPLRFELDEPLAPADLKLWQTKFPQNLWQIADEHNHWGWLLICCSDTSPDREEATNIARHHHFIKQSLSQTITALKQIGLIKSHWEQRQQLLTQNQELAQTNRLKSEFLANTSHEIRTPLSSILGFTHLLQAQGFSPMNLRHQEYLNIILTSGQHLLSLINDILDLSKIEANQLDLQWETVDVQTLCRMAMTLVKEKAADKGLQMRLELAPEVTTIAADELRLKQMLFNLLSNAIKFTLKGEVGIQVVSDRDFLRFTVWDTGTGIPQEQQPLLFRPYSQIANAATGRGEGTGLGLALTQKLAELHGGWVEVCSEIGQGSKFTIALPLLPPALQPSDSQPASPETSVAPPPIPDQNSTHRQTNFAEDPGSTLAFKRDVRPTNRPKRSSKRATTKVKPSVQPEAIAEVPPAPELTPRPNHLMLVEDNVHNAKLMLTFLSKTGYEVTWVQNGREMWQALERSLPSLILMDIHLPEVDGLTLTYQLKQDDRYQSIPVIAQTALAMKGDRELCLEAGAVDYISKPINLDTLTAMVKQYIESTK